MVLFVSGKPSDLLPPGPAPAAHLQSGPQAWAVSPSCLPVLCGSARACGQCLWHVGPLSWGGGASGTRTSCSNPREGASPMAGGPGRETRSELAGRFEKDLNCFTCAPLCYPVRASGVTFEVLLGPEEAFVELSLGSTASAKRRNDRLITAMASVVGSVVFPRRCWRGQAGSHWHLLSASVLHCVAKTARTLLCSSNVDILEGFGLRFREKLKGEWNLPQTLSLPGAAKTDRVGNLRRALPCASARWRLRSLTNAVSGLAQY